DERAPPWARGSHGHRRHRGLGRGRHPTGTARELTVDWSGWLLFGLVATGGLTACMVGAQLAGLTRLDIPLLLRATVTPDPGRARVAGFFMHVAIGEGFAFGYAAAFALLGKATWWLGALLSLVHVGLALTVLVPFLAGVSPRIASERAGLDSEAVLEPPGL